MKPYKMSIMVVATIQANSAKEATEKAEAVAKDWADELVSIKGEEVR